MPTGILTKVSTRAVLRLLPLLIAAGSGCAVGPDFKTPAAPTTDRYTAQPLPAQTEATAVGGGEAQLFAIGKELPEQWWTLFGSDKLNRLVEQSFAGSPTTESARAALRQSEENLHALRGLLVPAIDANAGAQREKTSGAPFGGNGASGSVFNLYNASISVSYALDLFGASRRTVEAQDAAVAAQRYELQATYLTLAANVVTSSIAEASLRDQIAATESIITAQDKQLQITARQYDLGSVSNAEVLSARSNLAATQANLPTLQKQLAATQNQLAIYLGKLPSEHETTNFDLSELTLPQEIPLSLPSELVRQRPDIRAAEEQLHQASAQIGVATAALYPRISISGSYGSQANAVGDLFSDKVWNIGTNLTQPIFHGGELTAKRRAATAAYDQAAAEYRRTVLNAFQNVADALTAVQADAQALKAQHAALSAAQESLHLTETQYKVGSTSYLALLNAQRQYQQIRIAYAQALASRYQDTAALLHALGGTWQHAESRTAQANTAAAAATQPIDRKE